MIADRLRKARLMAVLSQAELSRRTGLSLRMIRNFENVKATPSSTQLLVWGNVCGVRTKYFFRRDTVTLIDTRWFTWIGESE